MIKLTREFSNKKVYMRVTTGLIISEEYVRKGWFATGADLLRIGEKEIKQEPKTGRIYIIRTKGGRRKRHQSSAPGESHANLTGALLKSMQWKVNGFHLDFGYGAIDGKAPVYANAIENGFKSKKTKRDLKPRPTLKNSAGKAVGLAQINLIKALKLSFK